MIAVGRSRFSRLATVGSQAINVAIFNGWPDETVSGRAWRQGVLGGHSGWARAARIIDRVVFWQSEHCRSSHELDIAFAEMILGAKQG